MECENRGDSGWERGEGGGRGGGRSETGEESSQGKVG